MESVWQTVLQKWPYSERALFVFLVWLAHEGVIFCLNLIYCGAYLRVKSWQPFKIQGAHKWPEREPLLVTIKDHIFTALFIEPLTLIFVYNLFASRMRDPVPSWSQCIGQWICMQWLGELLFYWTHRLLHCGPLYKRFHKRHHEYSTPIMPVAEHVTVVEALLSGIFPHLTPAVLLGFHPAVWCTHVALHTIQAHESHSGFDFPWSLTRLIPKPLRFGLAISDARHHDWHHEHVIGNYGSPLFDKLFGTARTDV